MLRHVSSNGRATFSCVPQPARTVGKTPEERLRLIRERVGRIVQIHCGFLEGDVFLPNPAKHTDAVDVIRAGSPASESGWKYATRSNGVSFFDRPESGGDSGHRDSVILISEKPLAHDIGAFFAPADCAIVGFSHKDPDVDFLALAHSGWRGTAKDVIGKTVDAVKTIFGNAVAKDLEAFLSPHAKACCYEFGTRTFEDAFRCGRVPEIDGDASEGVPFWRRYGTSADFGKTERLGKTYLDSTALVLKSLSGSGIVSENVRDLSVCTVCEGHEKGYSSSRKDPTARFGVFMELKARKKR